MIKKIAYKFWYGNLFKITKYNQLIKIIRTIYSENISNENFSNNFLCALLCNMTNASTVGMYYYDSNEDYLKCFSYYLNPQYIETVGFNNISKEDLDKLSENLLKSLESIKILSNEKTILNKYSKNLICIEKDLSKFKLKIEKSFNFFFERQEFI